MSDRALVELRCSAIVFRGEAVLLLGRRRDGTRDWVLPGGHPRPREGTATCAYREVLEETGLDVQVGRVAFVLETTDPAGDRRLIEIVFLATERDAYAEPKAREPGLWPQFVPVDDMPQLDLRPPIAICAACIARACVLPLPTSAISGANRPMTPSTAAGVTGEGSIVVGDEARRIASGADGFYQPSTGGSRRRAERIPLVQPRR